MSAPPPKEPSLAALLNALDRMAATDYHEVDLRIGSSRLRVSRGPSLIAGAAPSPPTAFPVGPAPEFPASSPPGATDPAAADPAATDPAATDPAAEDPAPEEGRATVSSPMVGTFYRRPRPDAEPFASVGDRVEPGQVLCIIEAMKLMNNIEAETGGVVEEVVPEDGAAVQFGDPLFVLRTI